jgi:hypothetical protein
VSKKTGKPEPEPGNRGPGSGLEKPKTGYPGSGTRFLAPGFYRVTGLNINIYIFDNFYERIVEVDVSKGHGNKKH